MRIHLSIYLIVVITSSVCHSQGLRIREENVPVIVPPLAKYMRIAGGNAFVGQYFDLSGVGRGTESLPVSFIKNHGTQISGSFQLAAHHGGNELVENSFGRHPEGPNPARFPNGETLRFYYDHIGPSHNLEDPANFVQEVVARNWWVGNLNGKALGGDLEISYLQSAIPSPIAVYPILLYQDHADYVGVETLCIGKSMGSPHGDALQRDLRGARRFIKSAGDFAISFVTSGTFPEYGFAISGDSGSPSFAINLELAWGPVLAGFHWTPHSDSAVTTPEMRDALRQEMLDAQLNVPTHEKEVPTFFTNVVGDYDGNFVRDAADLDIIVREERLNATRGYNWYLDFDLDGQVTGFDVDILLLIMNSKRGDANLDGLVDASDLNVLGLNWLTSGNGWADGDFNGDGLVDSSDLNDIVLNWD